MQSSTGASEDLKLKPRNGLAGLRHWRHDLIAGLVVSFVSLPLSSGIAIASGAPPIYGIISAIIGGLVFPLIGGSFVTISGPAAGLAPALLVIMASLGGAGDADHVGAGYPMLLVVIFFVGVIQVLLAWLRLARYAAVFPASVVEGMLAAIGILVIVKATPLFLGYQDPIHAHGFLEYLAEGPNWVASANATALTVGLVSIAAIILTSSKSARRLAVFKLIPPQVFAVIAGVIAATLLGLSSDFRISCPEDPLSGIQTPDFGGLLARPELWWAAAIGVMTLTLIDGVESLATGQAIDRVDPFKRKSQPNRLLAAMGVSNAVSAIVGGLTVIPGGVKSKTCIEAGGRTIWSNFWLAVFLMLYIFVTPQIIGLIPKATLGAILIYTGWKMAHPRIARHLSTIGKEQLALYCVTITITLLSDLLIGVITGTGLKLALLMYHTRGRRENWLRRVGDLFRDPVTKIEGSGASRRYTVTRPLVCFNSYRLLERLDKDQATDEGVEDLTIEIAQNATVVDHTALDGILLAMDSATDQPLQLAGLDDMTPLGPHQSATRINRVQYPY